MSAPTYWWYADEATVAALESTRPAVLLLGGYQGYANFGDIVQLKGAIDWHRRTTSLEPIVVCDLASIPDRGFVERVRGWFGVAGVLFWSGDRVDASAVGLAEVDRPIGAGHLHVYGGGFLTPRWGPGFLSLIEAIHARFGVGHYVLSGQQIAPDMIDALRGHVGRCPPLLAGGRDARSVAVLADAGVEAADSFDDAIETIDAMVAASQPLEPSTSALLHLNLSPYAYGGASDAMLESVRHDVRSLFAYLARSGGASLMDVTLLQAYDDRRIDQVCDTLGVVPQLEDAFDSMTYRVLDLGHSALTFDANSSPAVPKPNAAIALVSSYHTALWCGVLGVPCYLRAENEYYNQKKTGLDLPIETFEAFLEHPRTIDLHGRRRVRENWLARLRAVYDQPVEAREPALAPAEKNRPIAPWRSKRGLIGFLHDVEVTTQEYQARLAELEADKTRWWEEAQRLSRGWQQQAERIAELDKIKDELWQETQRLAKQVEEQKALLRWSVHGLWERLRGGGERT